ncbi:MAG: hypothetical protein JO142_11560 [Burkholderiales bacterium]|nr:hypothetical protein [Burkholderiales bacterium]
MTSLELWKSFVDAFATLHDGVHRRWVVEKGSYPSIPENQRVNELLASLSAQQREVIAEMLIDARVGGVHDALVVLNDRMALQSGRYAENDVQMAFQPFGSELYYDYISRREGEDWPDAE